MAQSVLPAFLAAFRANLAARPGLAGVGIDLISTGDTSTIERIVLIAGSIEGGQERFAMNVRQDGYRVPGQIDTFASGSDTDVAFQAAMDRAETILDEVAVELDDNLPDLGYSTLDATLVDIGYRPYVESNGGWRCRVDFTIDLTAAVK